MFILVIDDDGLAAAMTGAYLEELGHEVLFAESASDALSSLAANPSIEMLISDLNMPDTSGLELYRQLRTSGCQLPFILLTGDDPSRAQQQEPGLDACILKDFSLEESLKQAITQVNSKRGPQP